MAAFREAKLTGWRRKIPMMGRPDFVFARERVAVFVDGCFWHGCPTHGRTPKTNQPFWITKIARNRQRDRVVRRHLSAAGWKVVRIWEHELRRSLIPRTLARIARHLKR